MSIFLYSIRVSLPLIFFSFFVQVFVFANTEKNKEPDEINLMAKETFTPIEVSYGDVVNYTRMDGKILTIELVSTSAKILYTNRDIIAKYHPDEPRDNKGNFWRSRTLYEITADILVNGYPMTMRKYVGSQESRYEPYVINGVRIWFDTVSDIFEEGGGFLNTIREANGSGNFFVDGKVDKNARFVFQDMTKRITPGELHAWFKDDEFNERDDNYIYKENFIDVGRSFNGDDVYTGAYLGGDSHGGYDINMPRNTTIYAPFDMDEQQGIRGSGSKTWPDGSIWEIDVGHIIEKYVPDNSAVKGGTPVGRGAVRGVFWHPHSHFNFRIIENGISYDVDAWYIFWQYFEDNKKRDGWLRAMMKPLSHSTTGNTIKFNPVCHLDEKRCTEISYYWAFGDGGWSDDPSPSYTYAKPGIYPVTLTIDDGNKLVAFTQHITVEGSEISGPAITLSATDEPFFRPRPLDVMDVYGWDPKFVPHTLDFLARPSRPQPNSRRIDIENIGDDSLESVELGINYKSGLDWLNINTSSDNNQYLEVGVNAEGLPPGDYEAIVAVHSEGAINSPQKFRVTLDIPNKPANLNSVTIDDRDPEFYSTPYFWIGHRFHGWGWPELKDAEGYNNFYLINGERDREGEYARFTPDLEAGKYEVWLYEKTPFASGPPAHNKPARFQTRIVHADGEEIVWMEPEKTQGYYPRPYPVPDNLDDSWNYIEPQPTRKIGEFRFEEGKDGFVEFLSEGSTGQIIVDAIRFLKVSE